MELTLPERAKLVVRYLSQKLGVTQAEIGEKMGYSNRSAFSAVLNGLKVLPVKFGEKLASLDDEINPDFLSGSSDKMLRSETTQPPVLDVLKQQERPSGVYLPLELVKMFTDMSETIRSQQEAIKVLVSRKVPDSKEAM